MTRRALRVRAAWAALAIAIAGAGSSGCAAECDRTKGAPIAFRGGVTTGHSYDSSPGWKDYLEFPAGRTYRFFHGLPGRPTTVITYFSFNEDPVQTDDGEMDRGGTAIGVGNQGTIEAVTDTYIDVRNDTCSNVMLRVVASDPVPSSDAGASVAPVPQPDAAPDGPLPAPDAG